MPAASASRFVQDMPPEGGYNPINYKRVPLKPQLSAKFMFGGYLAISGAALYIYYLTEKELRREEVEMRSCHNVMTPLLLAERDREYLKQLRRNRDAEAKLMANVPGWVVGTWFGEPIFKTRPKEEWRDPMFEEFYVHCDPKAFYDRAHFKQRT